MKFNNTDVAIPSVLTYKLNALINKQSISPITHSELVSLRDTSGLTPGMQYRLTDYECTVANDTNARAINTGHFDIILVADDETTLNENVRFIHHEGDTYFADSDLSAWEGKYSIDNDTNKFAWADDTPNGKGVIYWLKDEYNNECPYDFKNIQFLRFAISKIEATGITSISLSELQTTFIYPNNGGICYGQVNGVPGNVLDNNDISIIYTFDNDIENYYYTFTWVDNSGDVKDASIVGQQLTNDEGQYSGVFNNQIQPVSQYMFNPESPNEFCYSLNNIVFVSSYSYDGGIFYGCYGNKFGVNCYSSTLGNDCNSNTFGNDCGDNTFANECYEITFGNNCYKNTFGNNCYNNTFGNNCFRNTFGNECWYNTFGNHCHENTFGINCWENTFGNVFRNNTFGNSCGHNTIGNFCTGNTCEYNYSYNIFGEFCCKNTFGNNCGNNTFGNSCYENTFGDYCRSNTFGNDFSGNTLGYGCYSNTFGNDCQSNTFENDYIKQCRFGDGVQYCTISGITTSYDSYLQNITFLNNITSYTLPSDLKSGIDYQLVVGKKSDGTIIIVNPMDYLITSINLK